VKFSNATGSPSTNAMFGIETSMGRTPLQGASLDVTSPRARSAWAILLDRSAVIGKCPNSKASLRDAMFSVPSLTYGRKQRPRTIFLLASKDQIGRSIKDGAGRRCGFRVIFAG
jgi:hypothetical protein